MAKGTKAGSKATKAAGKEGKVESGTSAAKGQGGIFRRLRDEHTQISTLMKRMMGMTDGDERRELFQDVRKELLSHAKGEEREVYPVFLQFDDTADLVEEALEDHAAVEQMLERLRSTEVEGEEWTELFEDMMNDVLDHVEVEENELFPLAEKLVDQQRAEQIEQAYLSSKAQTMRQVA